MRVEWCVPAHDPARPTPSSSTLSSKRALSIIQVPNFSPSLLVRVLSPLNPRARRARARAGPGCFLHLRSRAHAASLSAADGALESTT